MDDLRRYELWNTLTVPTIKDVMRKLRISPLSGRKADLITRIIASISDILPEILHQHHVNINPNTPETNIILSFVSQLLETSPLTSKDTDDPDSTLRRYRYGKAHRQGFFSFKDLPTLKMMYLDGSKIYFQNTLASSVRYLISNTNYLQYRGDFVDSVLDARAEWVATIPFERLGADAIRFLKGEAPIENNVSFGVDKLEAFQEEGFLFWRITNHNTVFETLPYGLSYCGKYGYGLIEVDGIKTDVFNPKTHDSDYDLDNIYKLCSIFWPQLRREMHVFEAAHPRKLNIMVIGTKPIRTNHPVYSILNLGVILATLMQVQSNETPHESKMMMVKEYLCSLPEPPEITLGQRQQLAKWAEKHPQQLYPSFPELTSLTYVIEDLFPSDLLHQVLEELDLNPPIILVDKPLSLIPVEHLRSLMIMSEAFPNLEYIISQTTFRQMEEASLFDNVVFQEYLTTIVNQPLDVVRVGDLVPLIYYMTCRGFTFDSTETIHFQDDDERDEAYYYVVFIGSSYFACQIQDAGGLGDIESTANSINEEIISSLDSLEYDLNIIRRLLNIVDESHLLSVEAFKTILQRGYIYPLPIEAKIVERYHLFASLTPFTVQLLQDLILNNNTILTPSVFATYTNQRNNTLQKVILDCNGDMFKLISSLGMSVPPTITSNEGIERYVLDNFKYYSQYVRRSSNGPYRHDAMSDQETWQQIGGYIGYSSRPDLLAIYTDFKIGRSLFFVPYQRQCVNQYTQIGDDTTDETMFIIAFGNKDKYTCYTLEDLLGNFQPRGEANDTYDYIIFEHDSLIPTKMEKKIIIWLKQLLTIYTLPTIPELIRTQSQQVLDALILIENKYRQLNDKEREYLRTFTVFDSKCQKLILDWLREAFHVAMYMRQWQGPGHPFPLSQNQTKGKMFPDGKYREITEKDKDKFTRDQLDDQLAPFIGRTQEIENELSTLCLPGLTFLMELLMIDYRNSDYLILENSPIKSTWRGVCSGDMCIRQWSRRIVITTAHYLVLFNNENITGFDASLIEEVI
jgi:hypothetical protein